MATDRLETRIDPAIKQAAIDAAKAQNRSLSNYIACLIRRDTSSVRDAGQRGPTP